MRKKRRKISVSEIEPYLLSCYQNTSEKLSKQLTVFPLKPSHELAHDRSERVIMGAKMLVDQGFSVTQIYSILRNLVVNGRIQLYGNYHFENFESFCKVIDRAAR